MSRSCVEYARSDWKKGHERLPHSPGIPGHSCCPGNQASQKRCHRRHLQQQCAVVPSRTDASSVRTFAKFGKQAPATLPLRVVPAAVQEVPSYAAKGPELSPYDSRVTGTNTEGNLSIGKRWVPLTCSRTQPWEQGQFGHKSLEGGPNLCAPYSCRGSHRHYNAHGRCI